MCSGCRHHAIHCQSSRDQDKIPSHGHSLQHNPLRPEGVILFSFFLVGVGKINHSAINNITKEKACKSVSADTENLSQTNYTLKIASSYSFLFVVLSIYNCVQVYFRCPSLQLT